MPRARSCQRKGVGDAAPRTPVPLSTTTTPLADMPTEGERAEGKNKSPPAARGETCAHNLLQSSVYARLTIQGGDAHTSASGRTVCTQACARAFLRTRFVPNQRRAQPEGARRLAERRCMKKPNPLPQFMPSFTLSTRGIGRINLTPQYAAWKKRGDRVREASNAPPCSRRRAGEAQHPRVCAAESASADRKSSRRVPAPR